MNPIRLIRSVLAILCLGFLLMTPLRSLHAEHCSGETFSNPTCDAKCPIRECQDVSFSQDATSFQCCVGNEVPSQTSYWPIVAGILVLIVGIVVYLTKFKRKTKIDDPNNSK